MENQGAKKVSKSNIVLNDENEIFWLFSSTVRNWAYLNDLERGLIEGDLRPSSSMRLGLESLEEKWRGSGLASGTWPIGVPAGAGVVPWWYPPAAAAAAPNWCSLSCDEHWDWRKGEINILKIFYRKRQKKTVTRVTKAKGMWFFKYGNSRLFKVRSERSELICKC